MRRQRSVVRAAFSDSLARFRAWRGYRRLLPLLEFKREREGIDLRLLPTRPRASRLLTWSATSKPSFCSYTQARGLSRDRSVMRSRSIGA